MELFGKLESGENAYLYTIGDERLTAQISDYGATVVKLFIDGVDVVLGFDDPNEYTKSGTFFGTVVGRNANRTANANVCINGKEYPLDANDNGVNNLHSGHGYFKNRLWNVASVTDNSIKLILHSPNGDQGFPGNADIAVKYTVQNAGLVIEYEAVCDQDTVFNLTNHSYFNLAGHHCADQAMQQVLTINAHYFTPADALSIPTGELRPVTNTPMDFSAPKIIGQDINAEYDALLLQGGYDHNYVLSCEHCATLCYGERKMDVITDCPGVQFYSGNFLAGEQGKCGAIYPKRAGICLETQFWPDSTHHPLWPQPVTKAGERYYSKTVYQF